jgi:rubrerythrin
MAENDGVLAILAQPVEMEQQGNELYLRAGWRTDDPKGQQVFLAMADDERRHFKLIARQHTSLSRKEPAAGTY